MKLATIGPPKQTRLIAQGPAGELLDVAVLLADPGLDMPALIDGADRLLPRLRDALDTHNGAAQLRLDEISWAPPQPRPSKIVGVALNNNVFEWLSWRKMANPAFFLTPPSALTGHNQAIEVETGYGLTHPEPELAAIVGARLRKASPADALSAIFGYTIINDITSPGLKSEDSVELVVPEALMENEDWRQRRGPEDTSIYLTYHARSKGCDTFAPMGPWVATSDEIPDPNDLSVRAYLDNELVLHDSTADLTHPVQNVLAHLSHSMTLLPGDIVHFGTAARPTAPERYPTIRSLDITRVGHTVSVEIDRIGRLDNPIRRS